MGWFTWSTGITNHLHTYVLNWMFWVHCVFCFTFPWKSFHYHKQSSFYSTGRKLAGQGQFKSSKPKDPTKRHHLFKRRYGWYKNNIIQLPGLLLLLFFFLLKAMMEKKREGKKKKKSRNQKMLEIPFIIIKKLCANTEKKSIWMLFRALLSEGKIN